MRLLASLAALLTCAIALDAMQQRPSTPAREAAVPFIAGETLTYDVSWANLLTAGTAVTRVVQKRESLGATVWEISADGQPVSLIQRLYPVYYKMDTLLDTVTLLSQWTGLYTDENGRKRQTSMRFDRPANAVHYEMTTPQAAKADIVGAPGVQDGLALLYALRARTVRAGEHFTIPVADDGSMYSVDVDVTGPERVTVRLGTMDAWSLKLIIRNEQRAQVGQNITVWLSTDPRHQPIKMQAELPVGKFILSLREAR